MAALSINNYNPMIDFIVYQQARNGKVMTPKTIDSPGCLANKQILIVDDIEMNYLVTANVLEQYGAQCRYASSAAQAIDMLESSPQGSINLILMDIQMPEMDGLQATQWIRNNMNLCALPILGYTSKGSWIDAGTVAHAAGMDGVLFKPVPPETLVQACESFLRSLPH